MSLPILSLVFMRFIGRCFENVLPSMTLRFTIFFTHHEKVVGLLSLLKLLGSFEFKTAVSFRIPPTKGNKNISPVQLATMLLLDVR